MNICPAPIAAVMLVVSPALSEPNGRAEGLVAVAAEAQEKKQERKKLSPQEVKRLIADGDKLLAEGKAADARKQYLAVVEQEPTNVPVALKLGRTSEIIQDWDGAIAAYQAVATNAQGPEKAEGLAGLAGAYVRTRQFKEAADNARKAIELNPASAPAQVSLAYSLVRLGSAQEALPAARKAIELAPTSAVAHAALGEALLRDNKVADAEAAFRKALSSIQRRPTRSPVWPTCSAARETTAPLKRRRQRRSSSIPIRLAPTRCAAESTWRAGSSSRRRPISRPQSPATRPMSKASSHSRRFSASKATSAERRAPTGKWSDSTRRAAPRIWSSERSS